MLTNNPAKCAGLAANGTQILNRVPLTAKPNPENLAYLRTKQERLGHILDGLEGSPVAV
jgi:3,4-dihydroxy 2-butanone 4-phosphate synthase/GTP cyclohydrolase II